MIVVVLLFRLLHLQCPSIVSSGEIGFKLWLVMGKSILHWQPMNLCAGLVPTPSVGVFHQSKFRLPRFSALRTTAQQNYNKA